MCGIAGFVGAGTLDDLRRMNGAQQSRGPDNTGTYVDPQNRVFLGHLRLSILDLSTGGQPMWTEDGELGVVFNGQIYNHAELRRELEAQGARFCSHHADTEVLLHGYRRWGPALVERLNGMWAFVLYDRPRRRLFASRDRFGKKPFYYTARSGNFAFASELRALAAHPETAATVSRTALKKLFAYGYIPAPHAWLEGVHKLPGGCNLEFDLGTGQLRVKRWWSFELEPDLSLPERPDAAVCERLLELLGAAVERRLAADVPLGVFLSGGIDSSAVSLLAARALTPQPVHTFSIGFDDQSFDESPYAGEVARHIGSEHHHRVYSEAQARANLQRVIARLDEPMGDSSLLPTSFLCEHARQFVTVALGGDGGDELFGGYDPFRALRAADLYQRLVPRPVHRAVALLASRLPVSHRNMSLDFKLKRALRGLDHPPSLWLPLWKAPLATSDIAELCAEPVAPEEVYAEAIDAWDRCQQPDLVSRTLQFFTELYLQDDILTKVDRASMAHSLEVRAPFLDIELVDFVRRLPSRYKFHRGRSKVLLKAALEPLLPRHIVHRRKKGFGVPIGAWFKSQSLPLPEAPGCGLDRGGYLRRLAQHRAGARDEREFLWIVLLIANAAGSGQEAHAHR